MNSPLGGATAAARRGEVEINRLFLETRRHVLEHADARRAGVELNPLGGATAAYGQCEIENIWKVTPLDDAWMAAYRFMVQAGVLVVGEVRVYPRESAKWSPGEWSGTVGGYSTSVPVGGLTTTVARLGANISARLVDAQRDVAWAPSEAKMARRAGLTRRREPFGKEGLFGALGIIEPDRLSISSGRRTAVLTRYAKAARVYVVAMGAGNHAPVRAVARRLRVTPTVARSLVHEARANGLLLPKHAIQGRAQGQLTARARQLLELKPNAVRRGKRDKVRRKRKK